VWHELVLHGIGGRSIEEAKDTLSHDEASAWFEYIRRRGSLNAGLRIEIGFAMLAQAMFALHGKSKKIEDFMPNRDQPKATLEGIFGLLKVASRGGK
jgi:hypothetical protein